MYVLIMPWVDSEQVVTGRWSKKGVSKVVKKKVPSKNLQSSAKK